MNWSPLGNFNPHAPIDPNLIDKARAFYKTLPDAAAGALTRLYLHWTAGAISVCDSQYNAEARLVNGIWVLSVTHDPRDNIGASPNYAAHTYMRNGGALGLAITGMDGSGVDQHNFGTHPVTVAGLLNLCAGAAALCKKYGIDPLGTVPTGSLIGETNILTHAEAADRPGTPLRYAPYGPLSTCERWDLSLFAPLPQGQAITAGDVKQCGDALRSVSHTIKEVL